MGRKLSEKKWFWHSAHSDTRITAGPTHPESLDSLLSIHLGKSLLSTFTLFAYCKEPSELGEWLKHSPLDCSIREKYIIFHFYIYLFTVFSPSKGKGIQIRKNYFFV